jgi:hypothetical protein
MTEQERILLVELELDGTLAECRELAKHCGPGEDGNIWAVDDLILAGINRHDAKRIVLEWGHE